MTIPKLGVNVDMDVRKDVRNGRLQTSALLTIFIGVLFLMVAKKMGINVENQIYFWPILSGAAVTAFLIGYRHRPFGDFFVTTQAGGTDDQN